MQSHITDTIEKILAGSAIMRNGKNIRKAEDIAYQHLLDLSYVQAYRILLKNIIPACVNDNEEEHIDG